jgi:hypothetical protein
MIRRKSRLTWVAIAPLWALVAGGGLEDDALDAESMAHFVPNLVFV